MLVRVSFGQGTETGLETPEAAGACPGGCTMLGQWRPMIMAAQLPASRTPGLCPQALGFILHHALYEYM